jgi:hypothetical protein
MRPASIAITALLALAPGVGAAQNDPSTRGLALSVRGGHTRLELPEETDSGAEGGPAAGVQVGYGVTSRLAVFLRGEQASLSYEELQSDERYDARTVELGARFSAGGLTSRWRPYLELAAGRIALGDELNDLAYELRGTAVTAALGLELFLAPNVSIELAASGTRGRLEDGEFGGEPIEPDEKVEMRRFTTALSWRPLRRR